MQFTSATSLPPQAHHDGRDDLVLQRGELRAARHAHPPPHARLVPELRVGAGQVDVEYEVPPASRQRKELWRAEGTLNAGSRVGTRAA